MIKKITKLKALIGILVLSFLVSIVSSSAQALPIVDELVFPVDNTLYIPGSYADRYFSCCAASRVGRHLGEDIDLADGYPIQAIGDGKIVVYRPSRGYGLLVVVIEHDLGAEYTFTNAYGQPVTTRYILSIYGHLRKDGLRWTAGQHVGKGEVIGYVDSPPTNGDGGRHLHMGIRLSDKATAISRDPRAWFRGYEGSSTFGTDFASAAEVIQMLGGGYIPPGTPIPTPGPGPGPGPIPGPGEHSFGGIVTNIYNCSCSGNHLLTIDNLSTEGPNPVNLIYQPGSSVVYENNQIPVAGVWLNGNWEDRGDACVSGIWCGNWQYSHGTITITGTSEL